MSFQDIKDELRQVARTLGLTQGDIAERLGTSQAAVSQIDNPTLGRLRDICVRLGIGFRISPDGEIRFEVPEVEREVRQGPHIKVMVWLDRDIGGMEVGPTISLYGLHDTELTTHNDDMDMIDQAITDDDDFMENIEPEIPYTVRLVRCTENIGDWRILDWKRAEAATAPE